MTPPRGPNGFEVITTTATTYPTDIVLPGLPPLPFYPRILFFDTSGYDRSRYLRRARFDSIPEEVPEEDGEDDYDEEVHHFFLSCVG